MREARIATKEEISRVAARIKGISLAFGKEKFNRAIGMSRERLDRWIKSTRKA